MKNNKKKLIFVIFCLILFFVSLFYFYINYFSINKSVPLVEIGLASSETVTTKVNAKGIVSLIDKEQVYPAFNAIVSSINVKVGDKVTKGQLLAIYDEKTLIALNEKLKEAQLTLKSAELGVESIKTPANETDVLLSELNIFKSKTTINDIENQIVQSNIALKKLEGSIVPLEKDYVEKNDKYTKLNSLLIEKIINKAKLFDQQKKQLIDDENNTVDEEINLLIEEIKTIEQLVIEGKNSLDISEEFLSNAKDNLMVLKKTNSSLELSLKYAQDSAIIAQKQLEMIKDKSSDPKIFNQIKSQEIILEQAQNLVEKIEDEIKTFEKTIVSPIDGTILSIGYVKGQTVSPSSPFFTLSDVSYKNLVIKADIPEKQAELISLGQNAIIKGGSLGNKHFNAYISRISPIAEKKQIGNVAETVVSIELTLNEEAAILKSGYSVEIDITTRISENATVIPLMATMPKGNDEFYVCVVNDKNEIDIRKVVIKAYQGLIVEIEGIVEGEKVVISPNPDLKQGSLVRIN